MQDINMIWKTKGSIIIYQVNNVHDEYQTSYGSNHTMYHLIMPKLGQIKHEIKWKWKGPKNEKWAESNMFPNFI